MTLAAKIFLFEQHGTDTTDRNGRQTERRSLKTGITVRDAQSQPLDAEIVDLSSSGCLIVLAADLLVPSPIRIGIAGIGRITAQIVRRDNDRYGCAFDQPLSEDDVARAKAVDTIVPFTAAAEPTAVPFESTMPDRDRWPRSVRVLVLVAAAATAWALVFALF